MHPSKFLAHGRPDAEPAPSAAREKILADLSEALKKRRTDAIEARRSSGIEEVWLAAEEAYIGIDDANRGEFEKAKWAKPTSMQGGLTMTLGKGAEEGKSTAFVRITARYVDHAAAKLAEIILPIDDRSFKLAAKAVPDKMPIGVIQQAMGAPAAALPPMAAPMPQPPQAQQPIQMPGQPGAMPQPPAPPSDDDFAKKAEDRIYSWMQGAKYPREARKLIRDAARLGVGVLKGPVPEERKSKAMVTNANGVRAMVLKKEIAPGIKWVDPWNFFPAKGCGEKVNEGDGVFERDYTSEHKLKGLKKEKGYLPEAIDQVILEGPGKRNLEAGGRDDKLKDDGLFEIWHFTGTISREELNATNAPGQNTLPDEQDDIPAVVTMVNDTVIRVVLNPLDSGHYGYHVLPWSRRIGHWAGIGVAEQMEMPQKAVNAATRSLFNNAGLSAGMQFVIDQVCIEPADGVWKITPNKIWYKTSEGAAQKAADAFIAITIPSVQPQLSAIIEYGLKMAEESTSIPLVTQGQTGPTSPETFGQAELQNNNAHAWLRSIGSEMDDCITEPLVENLYEWLLLDDDVPDEEKGEFTIDAQGSSALVERAIQEQTMLGLLQASANPSFNLDPGKLMQEYLRAKRLDPRRVQLSEQEIEARKNQPPVPPVQVQVQEKRNEGALQVEQVKQKGELMTMAAEQAHEQQQAQMGGGTDPAVVRAQASIEVAKINAAAKREQIDRENATELAYIQTERAMVADNAAARHQERMDQRELAILKFLHEQKMSMADLRAMMAKTAMVEQTKRELAQADIALSMQEGHKDREHSALQNQHDREVDLHKHHNPAQASEPVATE